VYHAPYETALVAVTAQWRGRPLADGNVRLTVACPSGTFSRTLRTDGRGTASLTFAQEMPNSQRLAACRVSGTLRARGRTAAAPAATVGFIHPLWLERLDERSHGARIRIWGRAGENVVLRANGVGVARARIGRGGYVDVVSTRVRRGARISILGERGHHSHTIRG